MSKNASSSSSPRTPIPPPPAPPPVAAELQMESAWRIGRYTKAERKLRIERYRQKRARRDYSAKVLYECRKKIADRRLRVHGRFVKHQSADSGPSTPTQSATGTAAPGSAGGGAGASGSTAGSASVDVSEQYLNIPETR